MSYFSTEEVDNLKSLRAMVTEDLINEKMNDLLALAPFRALAL